MFVIAIFNWVLALVALVVSALLYSNARKSDPLCIKSGVSVAPGAMVVKRDHSTSIEEIGTNPDHALYLLQFVAQYELGVAREALAREIALRVAATGKPSIEGLMRAWKAEPELSGFVAAIEVATTELRGE